MIRAVLLVDDDEILLRSAARAALRDRPVFVANNSNEAIEIAKQQRPDLAIVDCYLGCENGVALIRELKAHAPEMRVVLSSGLMTYRHAVEALRAGADDVALKPFVVNDVIEQLERPRSARNVEDTIPSLARVEWEHIQRTVSECDGNLSRASRCLGIDRNTLKRKLQQRPPKR